MVPLVQFLLAPQSSITLINLHMLRHVHEYFDEPLALEHLVKLIMDLGFYIFYLSWTPKPLEHVHGRLHVPCSIKLVVMVVVNPLCSILPMWGSLGPLATDSSSALILSLVMLKIPA